MVDGLPTSGTRINDPSISINFDTWDEVQVVSDGFTPDFESSVGGIINIVTKSGGNIFHGEVGGLIRDHHLRASRNPDQLAVVTVPETSFHNYYGNLGGPIIKDKLWFFVSDNLYRRADDTPATTWELMHDADLVRAHERGESTPYTDPAQFRAAAVANYLIWEWEKYEYTVTGLNDYYRSILRMSAQGWPGGLRWLHGEDA